MAGLFKRPGTASGMAILTDTADSRKQCRKSTFVRVQQDGKREAQTKKEAQAVADGYEAVYRGAHSVHEAGGDLPCGGGGDGRRAEGLGEEA